MSFNFRNKWKKPTATWLKLAFSISYLTVTIILHPTQVLLVWKTRLVIESYYFKLMWIDSLHFRSLSARVVQPRMMFGLWRRRKKNLRTPKQFFLSTCPKPFTWAKNKRTIFFDGTSRGALIAFIWDHDHKKRRNGLVELLIVKQILLVSPLWNL